MQRSIQDDGQDNRFADDHFERQIMETRQSVYRLARRIIDNPSDAEDITQETAVRAWARRATFNRTCSFNSWVYRIATNLCIDHMRSRRRLPLLSLSTLTEDSSSRETSYQEIADSSNDPEAQLLAKQVDVRILDGIRALPTSQRACVLLLNDDLSYQEIADALQCPLGTVRSRVHRARGHLQAVLN